MNLFKECFKFISLRLFDRCSVPGEEKRGCGAKIEVCSQQCFHGTVEASGIVDSLQIRQICCQGDPNNVNQAGQANYH